MINSCRIQLLDHPRLISTVVCPGAAHRPRWPRYHRSPSRRTRRYRQLCSRVGSINTQYPSYDHSYSGWSDDPNVDRAAQTARYQRQQLAGSSINYQAASAGHGEFMKPINYYPSLAQRINYAISSGTDARQLEALIAEAELALSDAPDPARLRATLAQLKQTHAVLVQAG